MVIVMVSLPRTSPLVSAGIVKVYAAGDPVLATQLVTESVPVEIVEKLTSMHIKLPAAGMPEPERAMMKLSVPVLALVQVPAPAALLVDVKVKVVAPIAADVVGPSAAALLLRLSVPPVKDPLFPKKNVGSPIVAVTGCANRSISIRFPMPNRPRYEAILCFRLI
jgi:hypothetical protein